MLLLHSYYGIYHAWLGFIALLSSQSFLLSSVPIVCSLNSVLGLCFNESWDCTKCRCKKANKRGFRLCLAIQTQLALDVIRNEDYYHKIGYVLQKYMCFYQT